jgi:hypothetical protein
MQELVTSQELIGSLMKQFFPNGYSPQLKLSFEISYCNSSLYNFKSSSPTLEITCPDSMKGNNGQMRDV